MSESKRILIVDDDEAMREALADQLHLHGEFEPLRAGTAGEALEAADAERLDTVLLDIGLPDMDGRDLCRLLRRRGLRVPIIILTGRDGEADTILGLDSGANDYVVKPFAPAVLMARIRTHLREYEASEDASHYIGPYLFRPAERTLYDREQGRTVRLSDKENAILKTLYRAGDRAVGCDTLYGEVWGHNTRLATHTLQTHIYRLRQKIEPDPARPGIVVSELGGYRVIR